MSPIIPALTRLAPQFIKWLGVGSTVFFAGDAVKTVATSISSSTGGAPPRRPVAPTPPGTIYGGLPNPASAAQYAAAASQYESDMEAWDAYEAKQKRNADLYRVAMLTAVGLVVAKVIDSATGFKRAGRK